MKAALFGQFYRQGAEAYVQIILQTLAHHKVDVHVAQELADLLQAHHVTIDQLEDLPRFTALDKSFDFFISVGGDGTILKSVTYVRDLNIPVIGINTGRLGFLSNISKEDIDKQLRHVINGDYTITERTLLAIDTTTNSPDLAPLNFALNEVAVNRKNSTSMIRVDVWIQDEHLNSYWSDGLIVATPTGSTGYSLSCGGPLIDPHAANLVITPIAPHNLNARPLIIPDHREVRLKVTTGEAHFLMSLDSRIATLSNETEILIRKAPFTLKMIQLPQTSFIKTLRDKFLWGEDRRN
ncbi:MAG: NAD kinase [Flavobacteriaceae bacterium]|nr:NAD kinase [Flavobacteriaceae bacterium]